MSKKLFRITTPGMTLEVLLKEQLHFLSHYFDLTAISDNDEALQKITLSGIKTLPISMSREISLAKDCISLCRMVICFFKHKPDIIHSNTPKSSLLAMIAGYLVGVKTRIYTVTGLRYMGEKGIKRFILMIMERITCYFATIVIAEGKGVESVLRKDKITQKPLTIVGYGSMVGVCTTRFNKNNINKIKLEIIKKTIRDYNESSIYLLVIGRLVIDKGITEIVEAFKTIKKTNDNVKLLLLGTYEEGSNTIPYSIKEYISKDSDIIHIGWSDDVEYYIYLSHLLISASYREGFPNVLLQAGAMECPIVCSNIVGNTDIVTNNNTGLLFESKNIRDLIDKIIFALENKTIIKDYSENLKNEIDGKYSKISFHKELLNFYNTF